MDSIAVSVICNAYNHEQYIARALESFVCQKTDFAFEVLIHDDASTDGTAAIIREYAKRYPTIIKPIYQTENQYSRGNQPSRVFQIPRVQGRYVAICEGDDYWTDEHKLQRQYDALEQHPEVDICAHCAVRVDAQTETVLARIAPADQLCILPAEDVIRGGGAYVATNSLMYRRTLDENIPSYRLHWMIDYTLQIQGSLRGGMLFLPECMAAYRWMAPGSWTARVAADPRRFRASRQKTIDMLHRLDDDTDHRFSSVISDRLLTEEVSHLNTVKENVRNLRQYRAAFARQGIKGKIKILIKAFFPGLVRQIQTMRTK